MQQTFEVKHGSYTASAETSRELRDVVDALRTSGAKDDEIEIYVVTRIRLRHGAQSNTAAP